VLEYGVKMEIIPYIIDNNTVTLNILDASVSDVVVGGGWISATHQTQGIQSGHGQ